MAAKLYAKMWDFSQAVVYARQAGDLLSALHYALQSGQDTLLAPLAQEIMATQKDALVRSAMNTLQGNGQYHHAANFAQQLGDKELQAQYLQRSGQWINAARLWIHLGKNNAAGKLLEQCIHLAPNKDSVAEAHWLLASLHEKQNHRQKAIYHWQLAANHSQIWRQPSQIEMARVFAEMGLWDTTRDIIGQARVDDPSLPVSPKQFLDRSPPATMTTSLPDAFLVGNKYELTKVSRVGTYGRTYQARDINSGARVAVTLVHTSPQPGHPVYDLFVRDATLAKNLDHPHIRKTLYVDPNHGYIVTEDMNGQSLADYLAHNTAPNNRLRTFFIQVAAGLHDAHHMGIVHGGLSPYCIYLTDHGLTDLGLTDLAGQSLGFDHLGSPKIGDFGLSHILAMGQTQTDNWAKTMSYMAPEQFTSKTVTVACDLYSLGVTIFECVTGRFPFIGPDYISQHRESVAPKPSEFGANKAWDAICAQLLEKKPDNRFTSALSLQKAIKKLSFDTKKKQSSPAIANPSPTPTSVVPTSLPVSEKVIKTKYTDITPLSTTGISTVFRAVDTVLRRNVLIEEFNHKEKLDTIKRLMGVAQLDSTFTQKIIDSDQQKAQVIYQLPMGCLWQDIGQQSPQMQKELFAPHSLLSIVQTLFLGLAPYHRSRKNHGQISETTVTVQRSTQYSGYATILLCGLGSDLDSGSPREDTMAVISLWAQALQCESSWSAIIDYYQQQGLPSNLPAHTTQSTPVTAMEALLNVTALRQLLARRRIPSN